MNDLTPSKRRQALSTHESTIDRGRKTFVEVGNALADIRDRQLYLGSHTSFEAYCVERWDMKRAHAYRLIESAAVTEQVSPIGDTPPATESQARPLTKLKTEDEDGNQVVDSEEVQHVWTKVVKDAPKDENGKPRVTAKLVEDTVRNWQSCGHDDPEVVEPEEDEPEEETDPTVEEAMTASNKTLESLAREITALYKTAVALDEPHLDEGRLNILEAQLKTAAGTVRAAKGAGLCTYCDAEGCKHCEQSGWLIKSMYDSAPQGND